MVLTRTASVVSPLGRVSDLHPLGLWIVRPKNIASPGVHFGQGLLNDVLAVGILRDAHQRHDVGNLVVRDGAAEKVGQVFTVLTPQLAHVIGLAAAGHSARTAPVADRHRHRLLLQKVALNPMSGT